MTAPDLSLVQELQRQIDEARTQTEQVRVSTRADVERELAGRHADELARQDQSSRLESRRRLAQELRQSHVLDDVLAVLQDPNGGAPRARAERIVAILAGRFEPPAEEVARVASRP